MSSTKASPRYARPSGIQPASDGHDDPLDLDLAIDLEAARFESNLARGDDPAVPYEPYLSAVHSRSRGYAYRTPGVITGRNHHNLSRDEEAVLQLEDGNQAENTNIREQCAVPVSLTRLICKKRGWPHPYFKGTLAVLSLDFLVTKRSGERVGIDFKKKKDLEDARTKRKLEIVAEALRLAGATHKILTEENLPRVKVRNLRLLHTLALPFDPPPLSALELEVAEDRLRAALLDGRTLVFDAAQRLSAPTGIPAARLSRGVMWCIARSRWTVDLDRPIGPDHPVTFLK